MTADFARRPARLLLPGLVALLCACGSGAGGGGVAFTPGSPCNPAVDKESCLGTLRLTCAADSKWQVLQTCASGLTCQIVPLPPPGFTTVCGLPVGTDAGALPDGLDGFDGLGGDVAFPDVPFDTATDVAVPGDVPVGQDTSPQDTGGQDTGGPCQTAADCADSSPCTKDVCLPSGACSHTPDDTVCADGNPCTDDLCLGVQGCTNPVDSGPCNDGDPCTHDDSCKNGTCSGQLQSCDDGDPCTSDKCHPGGGCEYEELPGCKVTNASIDGATPLQNGKVTTDTLDPTGTSRWFQFAGKKGQLVLVQTLTAQTKQGQPYEETIADTVVLLHGPDQQPYAFGDDANGTNDSEIWTVLPATGTYYVRVIECWTYLAEAAPPGGACAAPKNKPDAGFDVVVSVVDPPGGPNVVFDKEWGNSAGTAMPVAYVKSAGKYLATLLYGFFSNAFDIDVFQISVPADVPVAQGRPSLTFEGFAGGKLGNGSTSGPGTVWLAALNQPDKVLGKLDLAEGVLRVPATFGQAYLAFVQHPPGGAGSHDFYVLQHYAGGSNPVEKNEAGNDTLAGAESLANNAGSGPPKFYVAGDLIDGAKDVDHFQILPPPGKASFNAVCSGAGSGSGLQGLELEAMTPAGQLLPGGSAVEQDGLVQLPNLQTSGGPVVLKISAAGQDPEVTGAYYECGFLFQP